MELISRVRKRSKSLLRVKSRSFTLIEVMVTVMIIALLAVSGTMALKKHQDRTSLDTAVSQLKNALLETQSYAFAPLDATHTDYIFEVDLNTKIYKIFSRGSSEVEIKRNTIPSYVGLSSNSTGYVSSNNTIFRIYFRTKDGTAGCSDPPKYYNDSNFGTTCVFSTNNYAEISVTYSGQSKTIKIQKITGEIEI